MLGVPVNPSSFYISTVQTGCLKIKFDSKYPINLNGIISQDEYYQSINRINRTFSSNRISSILAIVLGLSAIIGMTVIIIGAATHDNSSATRFPPLTGVGIAVFVGGPMFVFIGLCIIEFRRAARMRQAITKESMKYSSRSPTSCSWRLETTRHCLGGYGDDHNSRLVYHIVIDIGHSITPENGPFCSNQAATESTLLFGR